MMTTTKMKLCVIALAAIGVGATCAQAKTDVKTALDDAAAACKSNVPQGLVAVIDPKSGAIVQIVCATEQEIDAVVAPLLGTHAAAAMAPGGACPATSSVAVVVDGQGNETRRVCLSRAEAETAAAAIGDRRAAAHKASP